MVSPECDQEATGGGEDVRRESAHSIETMDQTSFRQWGPGWGGIVAGAGLSFLRNIVIIGSPVLTPVGSGVGVLLDATRDQ